MFSVLMACWVLAKQTVSVMNLNELAAQNRLSRICPAPYWQDYLWLDEKTVVAFVGDPSPYRSVWSQFTGDVKRVNIPKKQIDRHFRLGSFWQRRSKTDAAKVVVSHLSLERDRLIFYDLIGGANVSLQYVWDIAKDKEIKLPYGQGFTGRWLIFSKEKDTVIGINEVMYLKLTTAPRRYLYSYNLTTKQRTLLPVEKSADGHEIGITTLGLDERGNLLALSFEAKNHFRLFTLPLDKTPLTPISVQMPPVTDAVVGMEWSLSEDRKRLLWVFTDQNEEGTRTTTHLWVSQSDGNGFHKWITLTAAYEADFVPHINGFHWMPGGRYISFLYEGDLYKLDAPSL